MAEVHKSPGAKYWRAVFYDAGGQRRFRSTKCTDKRAAEIAAGRFEREAQDPNPAAENTTTLGDALEKLIEYMEEEVLAGRRAKGTVGMHRDKAGHLKRLFEYDTGEHIPFNLAGLHARHVDDFISQRRRDGAAENTIAKELVTLRCTLKIAKRRGEWHGDLMAVMPFRFAPAYVPRERWLRLDELYALLAELPPDHAARAAFEVATSANRGEADHAQREDVRASDAFLRGTKRASRKRTVPVVTPWQRSLMGFALEHAQGENGKLFAMTMSGFHNALQNACEAAGVAPCSSNDLRRTFCHYMRHSGVPRDLCAAMMGHGSTAMIDKVYGKLDGEELAMLTKRALGIATSTTVAQTNAEDTDKLDSADGVGAAKSLILVPETGIEPALPFEKRILSPFLDLPKPREYLKNRDYRRTASTGVAQQNAGAIVIPLPKKRGAL